MEENVCIFDRNRSFKFRPIRICLYNKAVFVQRKNVAKKEENVSENIQISKAGWRQFSQKWIKGGNGKALRHEWEDESTEADTFYNSSPAASGARPVELVEADFFMTLALNDSGGCRFGTSVE